VLRTAHRADRRERAVPGARLDHPLPALPLHRDAYFCFRSIRRRSTVGRELPFRLVETGFLLLTACFACSATVRVLQFDLDHEVVARTLMALEQGPGFLLGVSLLSYGIVVLIAELLQQHRRLQEIHAATQGELRSSEHARAGMAQRLLEAEALRAVGELAAGVAHDLRNPLAVVKAAVEGLASSAPPSEAERFAVIARNLARAETTIQSLLDVGRTHAAAPVPVQLDAIVADAVDLVSAAAARRTVEVAWRRLPGVTLAVEQVPTQRALVNLLSNAIEASRPGSAVVLRARACTTRGVRAWLAIEDRGAGLPAERERLFRPFFTTKANGTGLGLLSARRILTAMGGDVRLYPRHGGGTRALVCLPAAPAPVLAAAGADA